MRQVISLLGVLICVWLGFEAGTFTAFLLNAPSDLAVLGAIIFGVGSCASLWYVGVRIAAWGMFPVINQESK